MPPPYGTSNFSELIGLPKITTPILRDQVTWAEISPSQRDQLTSRFRSNVNEFNMVGAVNTYYNKAHAVAGVTVDQLKTIDMDADPDFLRLRKNGEFSAEGWFLYFWKEAKNYIADANSTQKPILDEMARTLFVSNASAIKLAPPARVGQAPDGDPDIAAWLGRDPQHPVKFGLWLETLLKIGFKPYLASKDDLMARKSGTANPSGDLAMSDNVALAKECLKTPYTWRADTRPLSAVAAEGGFNTKADQNKGYSASHGLRDAWHPFSKPEINQYYWFRRGSNDNCKYTVVSVGLESNWKKVISFPRLCDLHGWPSGLFAKSTGTLLDFGKLSTTDQKQVETWFQWGWMLPAQCTIDNQLSSKPVLLPAVRTYMYLMILGGVVINTNAIQGKGDSFPEVGVRNLALKHIYGAVEVFRFHHGSDDGQGYTAFVTGTDKVANQGRSKRFERTEKELEAAFNGIAKQIGALNLRWASDGCAPVDAEYSFLGKRIKIVGYNKTARPLQCSILW